MRRKKRLLFDVLDDVIEPRDRYDRPAKKPARSAAAAAKKTSKRPSRSPDGKASAKAKKTSAAATLPGEGIRLSYGMAGAVLFVLLVVVGVAYQFGFDHGEGDVFSREEMEIPLRKDGPRDISQEHWSVRAANIPYVNATFDSARELAQEYVDLLAQVGYVDSLAFPYDDEKRPGHGQIIVWAGQGAKQDDLKTVAEELRSLSFRGKSPFRAAYIQLFSPPKKP